MLRRRTSDLKKIHASIEIVSRQCGIRIEPKDYKRIWEHLEWPRCGQAIYPTFATDRQVEAERGASLPGTTKTSSAKLKRPFAPKCA